MPIKKWFVQIITNGFVLWQKPHLLGYFLWHYGQINYLHPSTHKYVYTYVYSWQYKHWSYFKRLSIIILYLFYIIV